MRAIRFGLETRAGRVIFALLFFLVSGCVPIAPHQTEVTTQQKFLAVWETRLDEYRNAFVRKDATIRTRVGNIGAELATSVKPWEILVPRVFEATVMIRDAFTTAGRGEAIKAFIQHMRENPTPGLTDVWFQRQAEDIQRDAREVDARTQNFFGHFDEKLRSGPKWIPEVEELVRAQGMVAGRTEELLSLHKQAVSYFDDLQQARAEDAYRREQRAIAEAQAAKLLLGTAVFLNQVNYQQQLLNTLNRPRTCSFVGNMMTCY